MADLDPSLVQQVLDVVQLQRIADVRHYRQADDLGARLEVPEEGALGHLTMLGGKVSLLKAFALTAPGHNHRRARFDRHSERAGAWLAP